MSLFTAAELEELRRADAELDDDFRETPEDRALSRALDRAAKYDRMNNKSRKIAAYQAAYYEANKDKIAARNAAYREANKDKIAACNAAYYEANKDKIAARNAAYREANKDKIAAYQAAYREANKEKYNAYMRDYMRKRSHRKEISHGE